MQAPRPCPKCGEYNLYRSHSKNVLERSLKFHIGIYEGIKENNSAKAVSNMKNHIFDIEKALRRFYEVK